MTALVFSVHADDAVFSCGEWIANQVAQGDDVVVVSICSRVPAYLPADSDERAWQKTLNEEHVKACGSLGASPDFWDGVDGKWSPHRTRDERQHFARRISWHQPDVVLIPLGIHHPDHLFFADILREVAAAVPGPRFAAYEDLPYRVLYPGEALTRFRDGGGAESAACGGFYDEKLAACQLYASQWGDDARRCVMAPERIWWIS